MGKRMEILTASPALNTGSAPCAFTTSRRPIETALSSPDIEPPPVAVSLLKCLCSGLFDQVGDFLRMRQHGNMAGVESDCGCLHCGCLGPLKVRRNHSVIGSNDKPVGVCLPGSGDRADRAEAGNIGRRLRGNQKLFLAFGNTLG